MFNLFKKKEEKSNKSIPWNEIALDFHSHLIPNVDDGSTSIEETIEILLYFKSLGYRTVYTSPHIMGEGYTNTKQHLTEIHNLLANNPLISKIDIQFYLIAEYFLDEKFEQLIENDDLLSFGDNYILVETSMNYDFPFVKEYIYKLIQKGYQPILAHPERYKYIYSESNYMDIYEAYKDLGILFQLNLFALVGLYGEKVKRIAEELIENNLYDFVSSDIHKSSQIKYFEQLNKSIFLERLIKSGTLKNKELLA